MANIRLFDGTRNINLGLAMRQPLAELAATQAVKINPRPGTLAVRDYQLVKSIESRSTHRKRGQVNLDQFIAYMGTIPLIRKDPRSKLFMLETDLFREGLNWCYGQMSISHGSGLVILSAARIRSKEHWQDLIAHELGHLYGAAPRGRSNTVMNLGSHCINDLCVMQQHTDMREAERYAQRRHAAGAPAYCGQCLQDMVKYAAKGVVL